MHFNRVNVEQGINDLLGHGGTILLSSGEQDGRSTKIAHDSHKKKLDSAIIFDKTEPEFSLLVWVRSKKGIDTRSR